MNALQMNHALNADLHCHSIYSDGVLTPSELAARAKENEVELWSLTDHDEVAGLKEAAVASKELGLKFLNGVEVSSAFAKESIHIVGLGVDAEHTLLVEQLQKSRSGRQVRAHKIAQALDKLGVHYSYDGALQYAQEDGVLSRAHFARYLVDEGICKDNGEAFQKYLARGKPGYVDHEWPGITEVVSWIHAAGGLAILAHPGRYKGLSKNQTRNLMSLFCDVGGDGIEVVTGAHSVEESRRYAEVAQAYGLLASRGSDFHGPALSRIDLGMLPTLPQSLEPVWERLTERVL